MNGVVFLKCSYSSHGFEPFCAVSSAKYFYLTVAVAPSLWSLKTAVNCLGHLDFFSLHLCTFTAQTPPL